MATDDTMANGLAALKQRALGISQEIADRANDRRTGVGGKRKMQVPVQEKYPLVQRLGDLPARPMDADELGEKRSY